MTPGPDASQAYNPPRGWRRFVTRLKCFIGLRTCVGYDCPGCWQL